MKQKSITTILVIILLAISFFIPFHNVYAGYDDEISSTKINPDAFYPGEPTSEDYQTAFEKTKKVMSVITSVGIVVSVAMTMVLGVRYMMASVEKKAEFKKTSIPMVVGIILLFSVSTIVKLIYVVVKDLKL